MAGTGSLHALHRLLAGKKRGDLITPSEILRVTGWVSSTLRTYVRKNKLIPFLTELPDGNFTAARTGSGVTYADVYGALRQKTSVPLILAPGITFRGRTHTYQLVKYLGEGASAHVWSATVDGGSDEVAVKIVNPRPDLLEPSIFKNLSERFAREAKNGEAIAHDCLVDILDYGKYRNTPFLVMEMAGTSTKDLLKRDGPLSVPETLQIMRRCVDGLEYLHSIGCIHRDVKPGNILETPRGYVLADLGIVKWSDLNLSFLEAGTLTTASMNLGSVSYIAPEQKRNGHAALPASDIYSLGVSWYELITGDRLIPEAFASGNAPPPSGDCAVDELIKRMTSYNPSDRPTLSEIDAFLAARGAWVMRPNHPLQRTPTRCALWRRSTAP